MLSGGGARGAYEAGVLSWMFEHLYRDPDFEFDIVSGTSVGAIHAAYVAATAGLDSARRSAELTRTWRTLSFEHVARVSWSDAVRVPLRLLGLRSSRESERPLSGPDTYGGLIDVSPLEEVVRSVIPWSRLRDNLRSATPSVLCISCTEVNSGTVRVFQDGPGADTTAWDHDPHVDSVVTEIDDRHVRASAAIPFLFPAVRLDDVFYVDGGLRLNTPLSPVLRLGADKVVVIALKHPRPKNAADPTVDADLVAKPAYLLGKVLDVMLLDPIENELRQLEIVNAILESGRHAFGDAFDATIDPILRERRGLGYRKVDTVVLHPSEDVGRLAGSCYARRPSRVGDSLVASLLMRSATFGIPPEEGDLLSYIYFDRCYTEPLMELGRQDAAAMADSIRELAAD